jgi:fructose-1,6-bisphosphatase/inositol monophosphatase family enzyme
MRPDPERVSEIIAEVGAREVLPRFETLTASDISRKASGDVVTVADIAVERILERRLRELLPNALVVGEEAVEENPGILRCFEEDRDIWIIDPIDGTSNFAEGRPVFAVMIALTRGNEARAGWIYDPVGKQMMIGEAGSGAYLNGERLTAARPAAVGEMAGTLHIGTFASADFKCQLEARRQRVRTVKSPRCAGHEYIGLASGASHFSLFSRTKPWDHVPGVLIHREAGGVGRLIDHRPYTPLDHDGPGILLAPDEQSWQALYETLIAGEASQGAAG